MFEKSDIEELVARGIFAYRWKLRKWEGVATPTKKHFRRLAEEAMKRAGVENKPVMKEASK